MAVIKNFNINPALNLINDFGAQFSNSIYSAEVGNATDTTLVVPTGTGTGHAADTNPKFLAVFGYQPATECWVANNANAAPSLTGSFVANASVINPVCKEVKGGDTLHFYTLATECDVSVAFYSI